MKIVIRKQLNSDPIIEFYQKGKKISVTVDNIEDMVNTLIFEANLIKARKRKKKG